jgi:hypothetical protein
MRSGSDRRPLAAPGGRRAARSTRSCVDRVGLALLPWLCFVSVPATAATLTFEGSFSTADFAEEEEEYGPSGIAHDPETGDLFLADSSLAIVARTTTSGTSLSGFEAPGYGTTGIDVVAGQLVVCRDEEQEDGDQDSLWIFSKLGALVDIIDISDVSSEPSGVTEGPEGTWYVSDVDLGAILHLDADGNLLASIPVDALGEPEGVDYDPVTGDLFFVSDYNALLYQITTDGQLVDAWDLLELSGFEDPEGVAIDAATRTIWISFDRDHAVGRFTLPEPAGAGAALAALAALAGLARRRGPAAS